MCENSAVNKKRIEPPSTWDFVGVTNLSSQKDSNWYHMFLGPHLASYRIALQTPGGWFLLTLEVASPFFSFRTVDGGNPAPRGMVLKPCKSWDKLPINYLISAGFRPSMVSFQSPISFVDILVSSLLDMYFMESLRHRVTTTNPRKTEPRRPIIAQRWQGTLAVDIAYPGHSEFPPKTDSQLGKGLGICWNGGNIDFFTLIFGLLGQSIYLTYHIIPYHTIHQVV